MQLKKINRFDLKELKDSPILKERHNPNLPFIVVNSENEILFGNTNNFDSDGMVDCLVLEGLDKNASIEMCFNLHYIGISSVVSYKNFNSMPNKIHGLEDLYLWNTSQFEEAMFRENRAKGNASCGDLF